VPVLPAALGVQGAICTYRRRHLACCFGLCLCTQHDSHILTADAPNLRYIQSERGASTLTVSMLSMCYAGGRDSGRRRRRRQRQWRAIHGCRGTSGPAGDR
jgi:hypothetical protein